jgi:predicted O-linked N-acetylglucosamine transferase (SPINDLY family)
LSINPTYALSLNNLGLVLLELGRIDDALAQLNKALAANRSFVTAHSNILLAMNSHEGFDRQALFDAHRGFARQQADPLTGPRPALRQRQSGDRIRVGYLSADFRSHSVSFFIDKILANHERASFEISCYSSVARPDAMTQRLAKFAEHWTDIAQLSDDQAAQRIRGDNLDILVELGGHTDSSRLLIAARRPAPVQVSYLGYPNTTGLEQIDYLVTDETLAPVGSDVFYSEKVIRLPRTFFCYFGPEFGLPVSPPPAGKNGYVTFAVLTNWMKVRPMMMELWARILAAVPNSRLLLKAKSLHDANLTNQIREFFSAAGIDPQRILTQSWTQFPEYLRGMSEIDIGLDTFPFNGHTTTCHQLWMGVPLVTLAGQTQASRMGQSILASLDLADLVANTPEQYLEIATDAGARSGATVEPAGVDAPALAGIRLARWRAFHPRAGIRLPPDAVTPFLSM